ncbi:MAG: hypothetical protein CSA62_11145, partial [Planctomycetota bacterium]
MIALLANVLYWGIAVLGLLLLIVLIFLLRFLGLWVQAYFSKAQISLFDLIGMSLRKISPSVIVQAKI